MRPLVVIPTYNEAGNIREAVERALAADARLCVLVVDDSSPDGTADVAMAIAAASDRLHVLRRPRKAGLGSAYREGFQWGIDRGFDVLVEMDADLSHDPSAIPSLLEAVSMGADLAIGSRYVTGGATRDWSRSRMALSRYGNAYVNRMLRLGVADATAGFRAFRVEALAAIGFARLRADGYGFQIETAYYLRRADGTIVEVPITFAERTHGRSKMSTWVIVEALALVTAWGLRDRMRPRTNHVL